MLLRDLSCKEFAEDHSCRYKHDYRKHVVVRKSYGKEKTRSDKDVAQKPVGKPVLCRFFQKRKQLGRMLVFSGHLTDLVPADCVHRRVGKNDKTVQENHENNENKLQLQRQAAGVG